MSIYSDIKARVTAREAAERYGIEVNRHGMARCPFHPDKTPSMKLDRRYYCFGCHATGDVIDLAANLFRLSPGDAARRLAEDFGIPAGNPESAARTRRDPGASSPANNLECADRREGGAIGKPRRIGEPITFNRVDNHADILSCQKLLISYEKLLKRHIERFAPRSMTEEYDDRFVEAVHALPPTAHAIDRLYSADPEERSAAAREFLEDGTLARAQEALLREEAPEEKAPEEKSA